MNRASDQTDKPISDCIAHLHSKQTMINRRIYSTVVLLLAVAAFLSLNYVSAQASIIIGGPPTPPLLPPPPPSTAPSILSQPKSLTVIQGTNATFDVTVSGTEPLTYQWRFENTNNIPGATSSSYTVPNARSANVGKYSVAVSNAFGNTTSSNAALTVNIPPFISAQPQSQVVNPGADATFSVVVTGLEPLSFQWQFNGTNISGATDNSFTRFNIQTNDAGNYSVVVTNVAGTAIGQNALLSVVTNLLYWDVNGTNAGSGNEIPFGSWTNPFWSTSADGTTATTNWIPGATAVFAAGTNATGTYPVTLATTQMVAGISFKEGSVTIAGAGALDLTGKGAITVVTNQAATILTLIEGDSGLTKNGGGLLHLTATNEFTGPVQIDGGVLSISQSNALGTGTAPIIINSENTNGAGATLRSTATGTRNFVDAARSIVIGISNATIDVANNTAILSYLGTISGAGTLIKMGLGEFRSQSNTFEKLIVSQGAFRVAAGGNESAFGATPTDFVTNAITLNGGKIGTVVPITSPANRGIVMTTNNGTFVLNQNWTINGAVSGPGSLIKDFGAAQFALTLNGSNTYFGKTIIKSGIIAITNDNALGAVPLSNAVGQLTFDGGRLKTSGDFSLSSKRGIFLGPDDGTVDVTNKLTVNGVISGSGSLTKIGPGTLSLGNTNTYSGGTTLTNGTLEITSDAALGSGLLNIYSGTFASQGQRTVNNQVKISGGFKIPFIQTSVYTPITNSSGHTVGFNHTIVQNKMVFSGSIDLGNGSSKTLTNDTQTIFSGSLTNTAGFINAGFGITELAGTNTYNGSTEIQGGTIKITADHNLGAVPSSPVSNNIILGWATLQASSTFTINANRGILLPHFPDGTIQVDSTNTLTVPGQIAGLGIIVKTGPGTLVLGGANNYLGTLRISEGTVRLNSSERIPNTSNIEISSGAILDLNDWTETIGSLSGFGTVRLGNGTLIIGADNSDTVFRGSITGIGNIVKVGSGTLTFAGSNDFTGGISIEGGSVAYASPLTVEIVGGGTITPNLNGELLAIGQTFNITAIPGENYTFSHWSGGANSTNPQLTFVMQPNLVLQANFLRIPSAFIKGNYNGLFSEADGVRHQSAGFFSCRISEAGAFSGRVLVDGGNHSFSGKLDSNHAAQIQIPRRGKTILNLSFQADPDSEQITGDVQTSDWLASLLADRTFVSSSSGIATQTGQHTIAISQSDDASVSPGGNSFGTLTVRNDGSLRLKGVLADNTRISQSVSISTAGAWPLYIPLYRGKGSIQSWVSFMDQDSSSLEGNLNWIKTSGVLGRFYPGGFSNEVALVGSRYTTPPSGTRILNFTDATISLSDGNLESPFATLATLSDKNILTAASQPTNHLTLRFNLKSGSFSGGFLSSSNRRSPIRGVVLQQANEARGFFLGTNQTGGVIIQGN